MTSTPGARHHALTRRAITVNEIAERQAVEYGELADLTRVSRRAVIVATRAMDMRRAQVGGAA